MVMSLVNRERLQMSFWSWSKFDSLSRKEREMANALKRSWRIWALLPKTERDQKSEEMPEI